MANGKDDLLNMAYINALPQPLMLRNCGDKGYWPLDGICVETGLLTFDVCGILQRGHIGDVAEFTDGYGRVHDADTFYSDYVPDGHLIPPHCPTDDPLETVLADEDLNVTRTD